MHVRPDLHVCFESMKFPGVFLNLNKKKCTDVEDWNAQFRVRAEVSGTIYTVASLSMPMI